MTLHISVWSDVACPWCYVGKRRLEAALATIKKSSGTAAAVSIEWKSFELDPRQNQSRNSDDYITRLAKKYGTTNATAQGMVDRMVLTGAEEGLSFNFKIAVPANTFDAHRLLQLAKSLDENGESNGMQMALKETLLRAHFEEGADIAAHDTLLKLAGDVGLDVDRAAAVLSSNDFAQEVREDVDEAKMLGVSGVPFFAIGGYGVQGAQRADSLVEVIKRALQDEASDKANADEEPNDEYCLPDKC